MIRSYNTMVFSDQKDLLSKIHLILAILMLKAQAGLSKSIDLGHVMRCGHLIYLRKLEIIKVS